MRITDIQVKPFEPRFPEGGYVMSHVTQITLHDRIIRLTTENGQTGIGEIVRKPAFDPVEISALEDDRLPALSGLDLADLPVLLDQWRREGLKLSGLVFGIETAFFDLIGCTSELPLSSLLGGSKTGDVPEYFSLSCDTPDTMAETLARIGMEHRVIQVKLGIGGTSLDRDRIHAVLDTMTSEQIMLADFNGALTPEEAISSLKDIRDPRVIWEEPCKTLEENMQTARDLGHPVMFDQCMDSIGAFLRALEDGSAHSLVIKPAFLGGLSVARTARDLCAAAGMKMRIDGPWSGQIAATAALHLALGAPEDLLIASANLVGPLETPRDMIIDTAPGRIMPAQGAGLGPIPDDLFA